MARQEKQTWIYLALDRYLGELFSSNFYYLVLFDIDMHDSEHLFRYWTISSVSISLEFLWNFDDIVGAKDVKVHSKGHNGMKSSH